MKKKKTKRGKSDRGVVRGKMWDNPEKIHSCTAE